MKNPFSNTIPFGIIITVIALLGLEQLSFADPPNDKTTMEEVKQEAQDLIEALKGYTADEREEAVEKTKVTLDRLDKQIDALESKIDKKWDKMSKTARKEARETLKALRKQRVKVAEWYGRLKSSSADAWEHVKKGFSDSFDIMHDAWRKAKKEFDAGK